MSNKVNQNGYIVPQPPSSPPSPPPPPPPPPQQQQQRYTSWTTWSNVKSQVIKNTFFRKQTQLDYFLPEICSGSTTVKGGNDLVLLLSLFFSLSLSFFFFFFFYFFSTLSPFFFTPLPPLLFLHCRFRSISTCISHFFLIENKTRWPSDENIRKEKITQETWRFSRQGALVNEHNGCCIPELQVQHRLVFVSNSGTIRSDWERDGGKRTWAVGVDFYTSTEA